MAMEAISNVSSIKNQPIPEVRQPERVVNFPEGGSQKTDAQPQTSVGHEASAGKPELKGNDLSVSNSSNSASRHEKTEEQIEADNERVKKAISEMNKKMFNNSEAVFGIHEDTNRITIKIVDKTTKETIKELPPEKTLDMIAKAWELAGLMVDEKG